MRNIILGKKEGLLCSLYNGQYNEADLQEIILSEGFEPLELRVCQEAMEREYIYHVEELIERIENDALVYLENDSKYILAAVEELKNVVKISMKDGWIKYDADFNLIGFSDLAMGMFKKVEPEIEQIINLTQHAATIEQVSAGVVEPENKEAVQAALTFHTIPSWVDMEAAANGLAEVAVRSGCKKAMIGGAPFFMSTLERVLVEVGITPVYAFSVRESSEIVSEDGTVTKTNVFRHVGFVEIA